MRRYLITFALALLVSRAFAQSSPTPSIAVSGKDHPELITDDTAYLHLFRGLNRARNEPFDVFTRRRLAYAQRIDLTTEETAQLFAAADMFSTMITPFDALPLAAQWTPQNQAARGQMVLGIVAQLQRSLGARGTFALTQHINNVVKRSITFYLPKQ